MTDRTALNLGKLIIIGMAIQLLVIGYVFYQSYQGRSDVIHSQRLGCSRGKKDRKSNAKGWRIAQDAREADGDILVAKKYGRLASDLEGRAKINCHTAFPKAGLLP